MNPKASPAPEDIRAVFFDIDGTLISHDTGAIPDSALAALCALRERGIKVCLASGRFPDGMRFLEERFPFDACVSTNGQYCYIPGGKTIHHTAFTAEQARTAADYVAVEGISSIFISSHENYRNFVNLSMEDDFLRIERPLPPPMPENWLDHAQVMQLIVFTDPEQDGAMEEALPFLRCARAVPACADVMPRQGGKHVGIRAVCRHFGFGLDQAAAFGDSYNDLEMLQHCALGVAMAGAPPSILDCAAFVTASPEEDGIYSSLQSYGLIG